MPLPPPALSAPAACVITVGERPIVRITSADSGAHLFYSVSGGALLRNGRVAITSSGTQSVLLFDINGTLVRTFGRKGEGPSEFRSLAGLWRVNDSVVMVSDPRKSQVTFLSETLASPRVTTLELASGVRWPAVVGVAGTSVIAINGQVFENGQMGIGIVRPPYQFLRFARSGALLDTIAIAPGRQFYVPSDNKARLTQAMPFGVDVLMATDTRRLFLLPTDAGRITAVGPGERARIGASSVAADAATRVGTHAGTYVATLPATPVPVTRALVARYKKAREAAAQTANQRRMVAQLDFIPVPPTLPLADRLLVDREGRLWVRRFAIDDDAHAEWVVISSRDESVCTTHLPANLRVLDVANGQLLVVATDADGLEELQVRTWRLN